MSGIVLLGLLACTGAPEAPPGSMADCEAVDDPTAREDCRLEVALPLMGDDGALDAALAQIDDPVARDLLRIRLAVRDPARAGALCEQVTTAAAQTRCRQVLGRPHLRTPAPE